ncbi:FkbM family methyltransferase [Uliginosibacterium aquaticum]|uniref:FkbM family methyltransferase n=1 Tax=Uliginosibacterium aquaticum TaxID=2731212 RepID=A0ABX2IHA1_9RHOO|nr:FkbM family methyltransferase [Uliginosibacterium aquaticum]NSL53753.1 FkbM family methyltransferase [Uliginosibacterium aquaticum]
MSFVSYAQNFEDVMLWRAVKNVEKGFYIDVGANDPGVDSVTKAFYERGWSGINIEPLPSHYADLLRERPRDINLQCAAGDMSGEIDVWECDVRGWATASNHVVAQHSANGHSGHFHKVSVVRLADICDKYAQNEIHFLKIDVEGFEKAVIEGMDFLRFRPWILVIEATRPNSTEEIHEEWEEGVLSSGYVFSYFDGLNRFYIAEEHSELRTFFNCPPNVFDEFVRFDQLSSELRAGQAEIQSAQAETRATQAETRATQAETRATQAEIRATQAETRAMQAESAMAQAQQQVHQWHQRILQVHASTSWRVTKPLRLLKRLICRDSTAVAGVRKAVNKKIREILVRISERLKKQIFLRKIILNFLRISPTLHGRLVAYIRRSECDGERDFLQGRGDMPPRAKEIFEQLTALVDSETKGS